MSIPPLPTKEFTILCLAAALFMIYLVVFLIAFCLDESELSMCKVIYFQDRVGRSDDVFCLTFKVKDKLFTKGTTDLIFRLRGSARDGPLILYRDVLGDVFKSGAVVNMGVALQLNIGNLNEIDIACDNDSCEEGKSIMRISDVFVRQLPKAKTLKALPVKSSYGAFKAHASNVLLNAPGTGCIRTWVGLDSVTAKTGSGLTGIRGFKRGKASVLRARDVAFSMPLTGETARFKKQAKLGFRPLHYLCSMSSKWHDPWSNFSRLDHAMVMCLDQLTVMVAISAAYAFNLESALGVDGIQGALQPSFPTSDFIKIEDFNLYDAITFVTAQGFFQNVLCLISVLWIALISNLLVCPLSLLWCRLFRIVGGKEFEKTYLSSLPAQVEEKVSLRSFTAPSLSMGPCVPCTAVARTSSNSLMLRTLECRSVHTASSVSSTRQLRMEPMISNCSPDHITARSVAYVRTKMTRLRDNSILSGPSGIKHPEVLHESHTQSTDAPVMPPPATAPDGKGEVVRVARFCERLVQQAPEHIRDNTMIAECFEVAHEAPPARNALEPHDGGDRRSLATKEDMCCPRQCCRRHMKCAEECFSNATFFTEDDIVSVKEMMANFSTVDVNREVISTQSATHTLSKTHTLSNTHTPRNAYEIGDSAQEKKDAIEELAEFSDVPGPSGQMGKREKKILKNSGLESAVRESTPKRERKILKNSSSESGIREFTPKRERISLKNSGFESRSRESTSKREKKIKKISSSESGIKEFTPRRERKILKNSGSESGIREFLPKRERKVLKNSSSESGMTKHKFGSHFRTTEDLLKVVERSGPIWIGRKPDDPPIVECGNRRWRKIRSDVINVVKSRKIKTDKKDRKKRKSIAPDPSAFSALSFSKSCNEYDSVPLTDPPAQADEDKPKKRSQKRNWPFKGKIVKVCVFLFLALIQFVEIGYVTCVETELNSFYESDEPDAGISRGPGRMHAAALSCLVSILLYFVFTIHVIALLAFILDWILSKLVKDRNPYYNDSANYML